MRRPRGAEHFFWAKVTGSAKVWLEPHANVARRGPTARRSSRWADANDRGPINPMASGCNKSRVPSAANRRRFIWLVTEPGELTPGEIINLPGFKAAAPPTASPAPWIDRMTQHSCDAYDQRSASLAYLFFSPLSQWYSRNERDPAW